MGAKIHVIGANHGEPPTEGALRVASACSRVIASRRLYEEYASTGVGPKLLMIATVDETIEYLRRARVAVGVLATGDPNFFGIARRISEALPRCEVRIHPAVSSVQLAFARIGVQWEDAYFMSLHGNIKRRHRAGDLPLILESHPKAAVLTGGGNTPATIARHLPSDAYVHVLERLGYADERHREGAPRKIARMRFRDPNVMLVLAGRSSGALPAMGLAEKDFRHERGLVTKDEVRAVALHRLALPRSGVLIDIGSGSGSVAIEAKRICPDLDVYAIERNESRVKDIMHNSVRLNAGGISVIHGDGLAELAGLPAPDRVFIGGGLSAALVKAVTKKLAKGGVLVAAVITLESLHDAAWAMNSAGLKTDTASVSVARSAGIGGKSYLKAMNTIYIVRGTG